MRRLVAITFCLATLSGGLWAGVPRQVAHADDLQALRQADRAFLEAASRADASALGKLLDSNFEWTDSDGRTLGKDQVLRELPKPSVPIGGGQEMEHFYGEVAQLQTHSGRDNALRIWVKRPEGWKALIYHEVRLRATPPTAAPSAGADCANPCKMVPYQPKNKTEREVIQAYKDLETAAMAHNAPVFATLVADEFVAISSNGDSLHDKKGRIAEFEASTMGGLAPTPLTTARMFVFGNTVVMVSEHVPERGQPLHVTRLWTKRSGKWVEAISYQTSVQPSAGRP
jgi:Domain of unknown function (DUF4440)